jgi:hypothetical protein
MLPKAEPHYADLEDWDLKQESSDDVGRKFEKVGSGGFPAVTDYRQTRGVEPTTETR